MLVLRKLTVRDEATFLAAVASFKVHDPDWAFAFHFEASASFSAYVERLEAWSHGRDLPDRFVPNTSLFGVVGDEIVGRVSLRHELNDFLLRVGGHVGYGVVLPQRRRGYATEMLRQTLPIAASLGIHRLLVTCDDHNVGSYRTIEANGGVLENVVNDQETGEKKRRYWISLR